MVLVHAGHFYQLKGLRNKPQNQGPWNLVLFLLHSNSLWNFHIWPKNPLPKETHTSSIPSLKSHYLFQKRRVKNATILGWTFSQNNALLLGSLKFQENHLQVNFCLPGPFFLYNNHFLPLKRIIHTSHLLLPLWKGYRNFYTSLGVRGNYSMMWSSHTH